MLPQAVGDTSRDQEIDDQGACDLGTINEMSRDEEMVMC